MFIQYSMEIVAFVAFVIFLLALTLIGEKIILIVAGFVSGEYTRKTTHNKQ